MMTRLLIAVAGLATFVVVYAVVQIGLRSPAPQSVPPPPKPAETTATRLASGHVAVALPTRGAEALVRGLEPGARLNVLASMANPDTGRPLTAVVTRGATIVQPVTTSEPMLVSVEPIDAIVLAHLVLGGTQLSYAVWPGGVAPDEVPAIDERTARALLGLPAPTPTPVPATPTAVSTPVPPPPPTAGPTPRPVVVSPLADRYVVQPAETLPSIADQLAIPVERMRAANPDVPPVGELPPGMQLVVPQ
jgi:hypothetical protein